MVQRVLGKPTPGWSTVAVSLEVRVCAFVNLSRWSEHIARLVCIFLTHQNLKPGGRPPKVFTHPSRRVSPDHCLNAGVFERALGQVRFRAATVRLHDNKLTVLHSCIICPDERERSLRHALC
jgi:hypothetical protein